MPVTYSNDQSNGTPTLDVEWIRARAKANGFERIEDLADHINVSRQWLHRLLAGTSKPNLETGRALAKALKCMVDDLYTDARP